MGRPDLPVRLPVRFGWSLPGSLGGGQFLLHGYLAVSWKTLALFPGEGKGGEPLPGPVPCHVVWGDLLLVFRASSSPARFGSSFSVRFGSFTPGGEARSSLCSVVTWCGVIFYLFLHFIFTGTIRVFHFGTIRVFHSGWGSARFSVLGRGVTRGGPALVRRGEPQGLKWR